MEMLTAVLALVAEARKATTALKRVTPTPSHPMLTASQKLEKPLRH